MSYLFTFKPSFFDIVNDIELPEAGTEIDEIWAYLKQAGTADFSREDVEGYWRQYSADLWDSEFITVDFETLEDFCHYLSKKSKKSH